jgi:hypothetical protein
LDGQNKTGVFFYEGSIGGTLQETEDGQMGQKT